MTVDQLKMKMDRKQAELKELQKQIKESEQEQKQAEEMLAKLDAIIPEIAKGIQEILDKAGIKLPEGKRIIIENGETGLMTSIVNTGIIRKPKGNGGAKIIYEGQELSWSKLCGLAGIEKTQGGSAHRDVYNKNRELHDSIQHQCSVDGKAYPIAQG